MKKEYFTKSDNSIKFGEYYITPSAMEDINQCCNEIVERIKCEIEARKKYGEDCNISIPSNNEIIENFLKHSYVYPAKITTIAGNIEEVPRFKFFYEDKNFSLDECIEIEFVFGQDIFYDKERIREKAKSLTPNSKERQCFFENFDDTDLN